MNQTWGGKTNGAEIKQPHQGRTPIGRQEWNYYEKGCDIMEYETRLLTLSFCEFGEEFTCDSGYCIEMGKDAMESENVLMVQMKNNATWYMFLIHIEERMLLLESKRTRDWNWI